MAVTHIDPSFKTSFPNERTPDRVECYLRELAMSLGIGAQLPRATALCRTLKISPNTLNKALRILESEGVLTMRRGVGIFVNDNAPLLSPYLVLLCDARYWGGASHSPFWDLLLKRLHEKAAENHLRFDCHFSANPESDQPLSLSVMREFEQGQIDGVLGVGLTEKLAKWIMGRGIPLVNLFGLGHFIVLGDKPSIVRLGVQKLHEKGCQRIGLWNPLDPSLLPEKILPGHRQSQELLQQELHFCGLNFSPERVESGMEWCDLSPIDRPLVAEQGYQLAERVFAAPVAQRPDGLIIADDVLTRGALTALRQMGIQVGRDVEIVSHSNRDSSVLMGEPDLILAEFDVKQMVDVMFERMQHLLLIPPVENQEQVIVIPVCLRN